ncbi:Lrp/AsnC family transcriptional regulator [Pyrobaculum aerophilum]|uniref:Transcriptional regulatory protein, AsnC family, putative n=2 Tax=Pyrobaculum aerophilum TaxID=13773 RepID=Q8ZT24_PYRAE|nr:MULTISPECIES: Lrp/AsnC ligand binding domain-containing protein [Pyrobaculum]AAL64939.1 transcriptional regulatory protein, AsnC family, putative [Pyrobaculum aerophilum str. IM2]MCX8137793.1 Lrp/AsnC ligand binding domain-containing protein [Pyrobaculum aerophilum]HII46570.1 Lrp/AsnC family transcriptional regulator [Pyrobaculum aerophilum]
MEAVVFLNVDIGAEDRVMEELAAIPEVKAVYFVYGPYDIIIKIDAPDIEKIRSIVRDKVRKIEGIRSTTTLVVAKSHVKTSPPHA